MNPNEVKNNKNNHSFTSKNIDITNVEVKGHNVMDIKKI